MMYIYVATRIITYFGTETRVFFEQLVCRIFGIPQEDSRSFKMSEMCGHVEHELVTSLKQAFLICFLPFTVNFILGCCILLTGAYRVFYIGDYTFSSLLFAWVGISLLANCAPSFENALSLKDYLYSKSTKGIVKILLSPFFAVYFACSFLERYSVTLILAILFAVGFPTIFGFAFPIINQLLN